MPAAVCIKTVTDDGSSSNKHDRKDVTRRTIHKIIPRETAPFYGSPDEEYWYVWTPSNGKHLLKREKNIRDTQGRVCIKKLFDAGESVQKRWTYAYDDCHRLTQTVDPSGRVESLCYDCSGRITLKATPEATIAYSYDLLDRVIEERKTFPDGSQESICTKHDLTGRVTTTIDPQGRTTTKVRDVIGRLLKTRLPALATEQGVVRLRPL